MATKQHSGISELPSLLPYPKLLPVEELKLLTNSTIYVIEHYGDFGLTMMVKRDAKADDLVIKFGDWAGQPVDIDLQITEGQVWTEQQYLATAAKELLKSPPFKAIIECMRLIQLDQAQYFFAMKRDDLTSFTLVDIQLTLNKLTGPGLLRDLFAKITPTQVVRKIEGLDSRAIEYINRGTGSYTGDLIVKPAKFKMHQTPQLFCPMYVEIRR